MEVDKVKIRMSEKNTRNHTLNCLSKKKKKRTLYTHTSVYKYKFLILILCYIYIKCSQGMIWAQGPRD